MARDRNIGLAIGVGLVGGAALVTTAVLISRRKSLPAAPMPEGSLNLPSPATAPAAPSSALSADTSSVPKAPSATTAPSPEAPAPIIVRPGQLNYTLANVVCGDLLEDPFNPYEDMVKVAEWMRIETPQFLDRKTSFAAEEKAYIQSGFGGGAYAAVKGTINSIPVVGPIVVGLWQGITEFINAFAESRGGFGDLPEVTRKRLALQLAGWGGKRPSRFSSQYPSGPGGPAKIGVLTEPLILRDTESEYRHSLRNWLVQQAKAQEFYRITKTPDEPILPLVAIGWLYALGLYPPPLQPMPLSRDEWLRDYPGYDKWYSYSPESIIPTQPDAPWKHQPWISAEFNQKVYERLMAEYRADAQLFADAIRFLQLGWPQEVFALLGQTQMVPRYGGVANPPLGSDGNPVRSGPGPAGGL